MQWPGYVTVRKCVALTFTILLFVAGVYYLNYKSPERQAYEELRGEMTRAAGMEWKGAPQPNHWPFYAFMAGGVLAVYILFFKVEERRAQRIVAPVAGALIVGNFLLPDFGSKGEFTLAVMLAVTLIAWLYPSTSATSATSAPSAPSTRNDNGGQT